MSAAPHPRREPLPLGEQLRQLASFGRAIQQIFSATGVLVLLADRLSEFLPVDALTVALVEPVESSLRIVLDTDSRQRRIDLNGLALPIEPGVRRTWETGEFWQNDPESAPAMIVALTARGNRLGVVRVSSARAREYDQNDAAVVQQVAQTVALALDNIGQMERSERLARNEAVLNAITERYQGIIDLPLMLDITLTELGKALGATRARIVLMPLDSSEARTGED